MRGLITLEFLLASVARSNSEYFYSPLSGMLVRHRVTPSIKFAGYHSPVPRSTVRVKCLAHEWNLMSRTIERTPLMWERGRGVKCCPRPESCLPCARSVPGASVSVWHIRSWDGCHGAQRQGGVYLCQAPGGMVARGSGCAHRFSFKLGNPGIASVWDWRVVASNTYPRNHLLRKTTTKMVLQESLRF